MTTAWSKVNKMIKSAQSNYGHKMISLLHSDSDACLSK